MKGDDEIDETFFGISDESNRINFFYFGSLNFNDF